MEPKTSIKNSPIDFNSFSIVANLITQSFGKKHEYRRAVLAILSFYARVGAIQGTRVLLFTDNPNWFKGYLDHLPVTYITLTPEKIKIMRGNIDFLHRMKIAMIEEAIKLSSGNSIYLDSDTFFTANPLPLIAEAGPDKSFMHLNEYQFEALRDLELPAGKPFQDFVKLVESKTFTLSDNRSLKVSTNSSSWNAGVMIFHPSHIRLISDVYDLTDQFYPPTLNHASEQYAFSLVLQQHTDLQPCDHLVYHYWYRVKKQITDDFLAEKITPEWGKRDLGIKLEVVLEWTKELLNLFENDERILKDNAIQAFNKDKLLIGYKWAFKALCKTSFTDKIFWKDLLYHTKRLMLKS